VQQVQVEIKVVAVTKVELAHEVQLVLKEVLAQQVLKVQLAQAES
jgi:hypothetical protein